MLLHQYEDDLQVLNQKVYLQNQKTNLFDEPKNELTVFTDKLISSKIKPKSSKRKTAKTKEFNATKLPTQLLMRNMKQIIAPQGEKTMNLN